MTGNRKLAAIFLTSLPYTLRQKNTPSGLKYQACVRSLGHRRLAKLAHAETQNIATRCKLRETTTDVIERTNRNVSPRSTSYGLSKTVFRPPKTVDSQRELDQFCEL